MKFGVGIDGQYIRPFIVIIYSLCELEYLSFDEFTYLLPLIVDRNSLEFIIDSIKKFRKGKISIDEIIIQKLMAMQNYEDALRYFCDNEISEEVICDIGLNRKSRSYDIVYYDLYKYLFDKYLNCKNNIDKEIIESIKKIKNNNISTRWMFLLYDTYNVKAIISNSREHMKKTNFDKVKNEIEFKKVFFEYMHLIKAKATLYDYFDLNKRYLRTTNCITFSDEEVELDIIPNIVFNNIKMSLLDIVDIETKELILDISISDICKSIDISDDEFLKIANKKFNKKFNNKKEVVNETEVTRYKKFNYLIDNKFTKKRLIELLEWFEKREDNNIYGYLKCEADIPTIFEYILGIIWYLISDRKGKILNYMKLSLDADLLPRTHAVGGGSDIVYEYEESKFYPKHTMLLEATLASKNGQRIMEMEPVSRHLGDYLLKYNGKYDYCTFITNFLNPNLISDYRSRKNTIYYDVSGNKKSVSGMKIIPFETKVLKKIITNGYNYDKLYVVFEKAYLSSGEPLEWYNNCIENIIFND